MSYIICAYVSVENNEQFPILIRTASVLLLEVIVLKMIDITGEKKAMLE